MTGTLTQAPDALRRSAYTTDLIYPSTFVIAQAPLYMQWAAAVSGAATAPPTAPFSYCDLGCGDGSTLNVLAAEYPHGRFVGVDINAEHLDRAAAIAKRAGLDNVTYRQLAFADLATAEFPPMDYIGTHGVYSWIDEPAREALHAFVLSRLKPGGLFCLHYSSLPGAAIRDPLHNYIRWLAERSAGDSAERFMAGIGALQRIRPHAAFFNSFPLAGQLLDILSQPPVEQFAHDVLNRNLHSLYCLEAQDRMGALGLEFVGNGDLKGNHPELLMTRTAYAAFEEATRDGGSRSRLTILDLILNPGSRRDVFRRPDPVADQDPARRGMRGIGSLWLDRIRKGVVVDALRRASSAVAVDLASPLHLAVLDAVGDASSTISAVLDAASLARFDGAAVETAIAQLTMMRFLNIQLEPTRDAPYRPDRRYRLASPINSVLLDGTLQVFEPVAFASPVLGSALMMPSEGRLRLAAWLGRDLESAWRLIERAHRPLLDDGGQPIRSFAQFRAGIESGMARFLASSVPELLRMGVLEYAD